MYGKSNLETFITICKIANRGLLYGSGDSDRGSVFTWRVAVGWQMGRRFKREGKCIPMSDSCWGLTENNTILYSTYPSIKNLNRKMRKTANKTHIELIILWTAHYVISHYQSPHWRLMLRTSIAIQICILNCLYFFFQFSLMQVLQTETWRDQECICK